MQIHPLDLVVFLLYLISLLILSFIVSREESGKDKNTEDYFLAGKSLPFWAIGSSLIAANISAEQIIGMSGSGYKIGLAIASYEWMSALTLILVGKYFLPIFLQKKNLYHASVFRGALQRNCPNCFIGILATFICEY